MPHLKASIGIRHVFFVFLRSTVLFITTLNKVWNPITPDPHFGFFDGNRILILSSSPAARYG